MELVEHGARLAEDAGRLSLSTRELSDLMREADHHAGLEGASAVERRHVDAALAARARRSSRYPTRVRESFLDGTTLAFLGLEWKFRKPILMGDTIHVVVSVTDKKAMPKMGGGIVIFDVRVVNQADEVVQRGTWNILIRTRDGGSNGTA